MKPIASGILLMAILCSAAPGASDEGALTALITGICNRSVPPDQALDPRMTASDRARNLAYLEDASRVLSIQRNGAFEFPSSGTPAALASVSLKTAHSITHVSGVELLFVKRGGDWYFADFSFLDPTGWYVFLSLLALAVTALSTIALLYWGRHRRNAASREAHQ